MDVVEKNEWYMNSYQICVYSYAWTWIASAHVEASAIAICDALAAQTGYDHCVMDDDDVIIHEAKGDPFKRTKLR